MSRCGPGTVIVAQCQPECPETPEIELQNINLSGIGVLDSWDGLTGNFRGNASANSMLGITLDNVNHNALYTISIDAIAAAFPAATESVSGSIQIATTAETTAGTNDATAVSPLKLQEKLATQKLTQTFLTSALGTAVPAFTGQIGSTTDGGNQVYVGQSTSAGAWVPVITLTGTNDIYTSLNLDMSNGGGVNFDGGTVGVVNFFDLSFISFTDSVLTFDTGSQFAFNSVAMNISTLLGTNGAGNIDEFAINNFISSYNTQTGWGTPSGPLSRLTFASYNGQVISNPPTQAEVQLLDAAVQEASQRLAALITDLKAKKLPAT